MRAEETPGPIGSESRGPPAGRRVGDPHGTNRSRSFRRARASRPRRAPSLQPSSRAASCCDRPSRSQSTAPSGGPRTARAISWSRTPRNSACAARGLALGLRARFPDGSRVVRGPAPCRIGPLVWPRDRPPRAARGRAAGNGGASGPCGPGSGTSPGTHHRRRPGWPAAGGRRPAPSGRVDRPGPPRRFVAIGHEPPKSWPSSRPVMVPTWNNRSMCRSVARFGSLAISPPDLDSRCAVPVLS